MTVVRSISLVILIILSIINMRWYLFVCLWLNHAITTEPMSMKVYTNMAYLCGSDMDLFSVRHLSPFVIVLKKKPLTKI